MKSHFQMFAAYNAWANNLVYEAAFKLPEEQYNRNTGAFFGSLNHTLNHIYLADLIWMHRFTGEGTQPGALDLVLHPEFSGLHAARLLEDRRIANFIDTLDEDRLASTITYSPIGKPDRINQRLQSALPHFFNHHTHHRGQCHTILTSLGQPSLTMDLVYFLRAEGREWL